MRTPDEMRQEAAELLAAADASERQLTREDLAGMSAADVAAAREAGRLAVLLGADPDALAFEKRCTRAVLDADDVKRLAAAGRHDLIEAARLGGRITNNTTKEN